MWITRTMVLSSLLIGAALPVQATGDGADKSQVGPISAEAMARMRELRPGEYLAKTREGCNVITDEPHPSRKEAFAAVWARFTWEGVCSEGMALGPGKLISRTENGETVSITEGWQLIGRWIGLSVVTNLFPGASYGSKTEVFYWDGEGYGRNVVRSEPLEARKERPWPSVSYLPRDRSQRVYYSLFGSCGANAQPCVSEWKPPYPPVADASAGRTELYCNGSCGNLWVEKAGPIITAFDTFAKTHAADVAAVKQALEPLLVQRRREAVEAEAQARRKAVEAEVEAKRKAAQAELAVQAEVQRKRDEAARAEQQFRASLQTMNPGQLFAKADELSAQGDSARAREVQRALMSRFPNHSLAATAASQMAGESSTSSATSSNATSAAGARITAPTQASAPSISRSQVVQAGAKGVGKPIWPTDMEPGNLYFLEVANGPRSSSTPVVMVSAASAQEALSRFQSLVDKTPGGARYKVAAGGECIGPAWGAVVINRQQTMKDSYSAWGSACDKTPAAAIEAAFAVCLQKDPRGLGCDHRRSGAEQSGWFGPTIALALSGSTSWNGRLNWSGAPSTEDNFGSYNAFTHLWQLNSSHIEGMQHAVSGFDKACAGLPCYKTSSNFSCVFETLLTEVVDKCMDRKLTPAGLSGSMRSRLR